MKFNLLILFSVACREYLAHDCYHTRDCRDILSTGLKASGVYHVTPPGTFYGIDVYCDMDTDGGGWLVVQRRQDGSEDFYRGWDDYQQGFGNVTEEFWIGNLFLHILTSSGFYEACFDLEDWDGNKLHIVYKIFKVDDSTTNYKLTMSGFSGGFFADVMKRHNGQPFTTNDRDNDSDETANCAVEYYGAWWYHNCQNVNINGIYLQNKATGVRWHQTAIKKTEVKIRRR